MSMMDALMRVHLNELVTVERAVQAVRRFATFNASSELPYDAEDALLFWLNKVAVSVKQRVEKQVSGSKSLGRIGSVKGQWYKRQVSDARSRTSQKVKLVDHAETQSPQARGAPCAGPELPPRKARVRPRG